MQPPLRETFPPVLSLSPGNMLTPPCVAAATQSERLQKCLSPCILTLTGALSVGSYEVCVSARVASRRRLKSHLSPGLASYRRCSFMKEQVRLPLVLVCTLSTQREGTEPTLQVKKKIPGLR
jgi:hypothetical protein